MLKKLKNLRIRSTVIIVFGVTYALFITIFALVINHYLKSQVRIEDYSEVNQFTWQVVIYTTLPLLAIFLVVEYVLHCTIYNPLEAIRTRAQAIASGNQPLGDELALPAGRELRLLTQDFNAMSARLQQEQGMLEAGVAQRTEALEHEIAEHKLALFHLRESEARYRSLFDDSPIAMTEEDFSGMVAILDDLKKQGVSDFRAYLRERPDTMLRAHSVIRLVDANKAALRLFGYETVESMRAEFAHFTGGTEINQEAVIDGLVCVAEGQTRYDVEKVNYTSHGEKMFIQQVWCVAPGFTQTYGKVVNTVTDITQRKKSEAALKESEEKYRNLFDTELDALLLIDNHVGQILEVNRSAEEMYGYTRAELLTMRNFDLSAQPDETQRLTEKRNAFVPLRYHRKKDGTVFPVEITASHFTWQGRPAHTAAVRDITQRIESEFALRESEARFRAFMDNAHSLMVVKDHELRQVYANQHFRAMFPADDWMDKTPHEAFPAGIADTMVENDRKALAEGFIQYEETWTDSSGVVRTFETRKFRIDRLDAPPLLGAIISDITERKQAEESLRQSEERLTLINDSSLDILYSYDTQGRFTSGNRRLSEALQKPLQEIVWKTHTELGFPEEQCRDWDVLHKKVIQSNQTVTSLTSTPLPDGNLYYFEVVLNPLHDENGTIIGIGGTTRDITDRKRAEDALMIKTEELEGFFNSALDLLSIINLDGVFLRVNHEWENVLGYTLQEIVGHRDLEFIHPDDLPATLAAIQKMGQSRELRGFVNRYRCKDGSYRWLEWHSHQIGERIYAAAMDMTPRMKALADLAESEEKYRTLHETMAQGVVYQDADGHIISANTAAERSLGLTHDQLLGLTSMDPRWRTIHEDGSPFPGSEHPAMVALRTGRPVEDVTIGVFHPALEEYRWILVNAVPLFRPGEEKPYQVYATFTDLTERKQMQAIMLAAEKMAGLGTLAAGIAHEINSPLQIITGTSENLLKQISEGKNPDPPRLHSKMENIHRSAWRVAEIVRSLLAYSHPSSQKFEDHDLNDIVKDTLLLIEHQLKSWNSIFVTTELAPNLPSLHCDRNQVSQALINLLTNARDAMPSGGTIVIRTSINQVDRQLALEVIDPGIGIPPGMQTLIFDPFFTTKEIGKGTGLGLSIVSGMVRLHGGKIEVESQEGKGTKICVWFPLDRPDATFKTSSAGRF